MILLTSAEECTIKNCMCSYSCVGKYDQDRHVEIRQLLGMNLEVHSLLYLWALHCSGVIRLAQPALLPDDPSHNHESSVLPL